MENTGISNRSSTVCNEIIEEFTHNKSEIKYEGFCEERRDTERIVMSFFLTYLSFFIFSLCRNTVSRTGMSILRHRFRFAREWLAITSITRLATDRAINLDIPNLNAKSLQTQVQRATSAKARR